MTTQSLSEHVLLIALPAELESSSELEVVARSVHRAFGRDVVVDFSRVETLPSITIGHLIVLERVLSAAGRQLVLCGVLPAVGALFQRVGLHKLFRFADNELAAVQSLDRGEYMYP
jgi:anti-anti-sigma regulatory factor